MISPSIKSLILDMDGVLWTENDPIGDLPKIFSAISDRNLKVAMATNNSTKTPNQYIDRLKGYSVNNLEEWQVITSSLVLASHLSGTFAEGGDVFVIGEDGLKKAIEEKGFRVVDEEHASQAVAVAVGIDRKINYNKLRVATLLIRKGLPFLGTNPDKTFPTPEGLILGSGAFLAALTTATDIEPMIMGKPSPSMIRMARERLGTLPHETLVIGDRIETDIASGQADHCSTALVYSGVTSSHSAINWTPMPDYFAKDLADLLEIQ
jgi:4-nitrophenyl phosphatase